MPSTNRPGLKPGLVEALTSAYATLIKRQRTASAAFVRWSSPHRRAHEFAWLETGSEVLITKGHDLRISPSSPIHDSINKMRATIELNPYERELQYGYPYIVGFIDGVPIRAPLLAIPVTITAEGGTLIVSPDDDVVRFNSLPFRSEYDTAAHELALARLIEATPEYPVGETALRMFCESVAREMKVLVRGRLDGTLDVPPSQPRSASQLTIVDNAACFVAPKTSYFLASDLEYIGKVGASAVAETALGWLIGTRGEQPTSNAFGDTHKVFFPFGSNPSQRRVAVLADDPENNIIVVQGPPGTGKSQTIANVACHLVARGKRVLIASQKDKALEVVDEMLRRLELAELPMTLLSHDRESKRELRERLDSIQKSRAAEETQRERDNEFMTHAALVEGTLAKQRQLADALFHEHLVAKADGKLAEASGVIRRIKAWVGFQRAQHRANRHAPQKTDVLGNEMAARRAQLLQKSLGILKIAAEHRTGEATKAERNQLREFSKLLGRNQTSFKNFSVFDRMKSEPNRCHMLLKILPCWIMTPDDVARLFPCEPGLFDVVIIDEASQCDLPSMTPVLYRAKQAIIAGDSKQMQAQRFAFTSNQVAAQAWKEQGLDKFDPDRWLDPAKIDLLQLASFRMDEEVFLDEHFRSLPAIINFSNKRWYGERMRIMRDADDRRVGDPDAPVIRLYHMSDGRVSPGTQENDREAAVLVEKLKDLLNHPGYGDASFGVICLFEQQMRLVNDLVAEEIPEELRTAHDLVIVNPDGFQGDERDVILYSLSYDAAGMEQSALSARQAEREHIQGMLNVAFTRAREEMHVFHTARIDQFGMASGEGVIRDWLEYCGAIEKNSEDDSHRGVVRCDSEFEAQVIQALAARGIKTITQYPSCGYFIDVVAEEEDRRVAIECDGEVWHLDEHGELKAEDLRRQEILERAGWTVIRVPYRGWRENPDAQIQRILVALSRSEEEEYEEIEAAVGGIAPKLLHLTIYEAAILRALREGARDREIAIKAARVHLGKARLGPQIKRSLEYAITALESRKLIFTEETELFASDEGRSANISTYIPSMSRTRKLSSRRRRYYRRYSSYRRW